MIKANEGDYEQDGILCCANCHTRKQVKVNVLGVEKTLFCLCKCETEKRDKEQAEFEEKQRLARLQELKRMGFADSELRKWTFDNTDEIEKTTRTAKNYVEHFDTLAEAGKGLLFYGSVGTGKSVLAACIVNALTDKGHPCLMTSLTKINYALQGMYEGRESYIEGLNKFRLLVLDDLGTERDTEYMSEVVQMVIDSRYRANLPLIVTTNYTSEEMMNAADIKKRRLFSRLYEMCVPVKVEGEDRRRKKMVSDHHKYSELLGL